MSIGLHVPEWLGWVRKGHHQQLEHYYDTLRHEPEPEAEPRVNFDGKSSMLGDEEACSLRT